MLWQPNLPMMRGYMRQIKIHDKAIYDRRDRWKYKMQIICISIFICFLPLISQSNSTSHVEAELTSRSHPNQLWGIHINKQEIYQNKEDPQGQTQLGM